MTIKIVPIPRLYGELKDKLYSRYDEVYTAGKQMWEGEYCVKCEDFLKQISNRKYAFLTTSGTSSIQIMLLALGIEPGDEIISINCSAPGTVMPIKVMGANAVYCDLNEYGQQDLTNIESLITDKTKAIEATGLYGDCYDHDRIKDLGLPILNDAAQSFYAKYKGIESIKFGDMSIISFSSNKTCPIFGTYGAVLTDNDELAEKISLMRRNGYKSRDVGKGIKYIGINAQPTEDKCVQVLCSLEKLNAWKTRKKKVHEYYNEQFTKAGIKIRKSPTYSQTNYHKYCIFVNNNEKFRDKLAEDSIECQLHYKYNFAHTPVLTNGETQSYNFTNFFNQHSISIPANQWLTDSEVEEVANKIIKNITSEDLNL